MANIPFLQQLAIEYLDNEAYNLIDYCFITPNKRSAAFLRHYFSEEEKAKKNNVILPEIITISDFISNLTATVEVGKIEQIFILYKVYSRIVKDNATPAMKEKGEDLIDFNKFLYWAEVVLNDFNDVDKYLVDAEQLFHNIETIKEINANYLTPEQINVIRRYWNEADIPSQAKDFWNHIFFNKDGTTETASSRRKNVPGFVKLWQSMYRLYSLYKEELRKLGYSYSGMSYRDAVDRLRMMSSEEFPFKRFIFVGFNVLSTSEIEIFESLQRKGIADFYWDFASPAFEFKSNTATRFLGELVKKFPSKYPVVGERIFTFPKIEVISVPSNHAQAKLISEAIEKIYPEMYDDAGRILPEPLDEKGKIDKEAVQNPQADLFKTAIVLPNEKFCMPLMRALPEGMTNINITMGYPLRQTPVASLIRNIISLQLRARINKKGAGFFYKDVINILSNPLISDIAPEACDYLTALITHNRYFMVPESVFLSDILSPLRPIFIMADVNDWVGALQYLASLIELLRNSIDSRITTRNGNNITEGIDIINDMLPDSNEKVLSMERVFLDSYSDAIDRLQILINNYLPQSDIFLDTKTVFHLVERLLGNLKVNFTGMPLRGLQIMGVLENRNLDFENVIIPSMNERIFPRRHFTKSFIPNALRTAFGMSTLDHQESIYAYYFYRMITRAQRVILLYDARSVGAKSGQVSRYINQLKFIVPEENLYHTSKSFEILTAEKISTIEIPKTDSILKKLDLFKSDKKNCRYLSASSINTYINCPLQFYLQNIEQYYQDDELNDFMDDSVFGKVVHSALEILYKQEQIAVNKTASKPLLVNETVLNSIRESNKVKEAVARAIRKEYLKNTEDTTPFVGQNAIYHEIMTKMVKKLLEKESSRVPYYFEDAEHQVEVPFKVSEDLTVNLRFIIDRIDSRVNSSGERVVELIDYKTGSDDVKTSGLYELFNQESEKRPKAILQLLLYCNAYAQKNKYEGSISPWIFSLRKIGHNGYNLNPVVIGKEEIKDYHTVNEEFMEKLNEVIHEMFDKDIPFINRPSEHHCKYCQFRDFCS